MDVLAEHEGKIFAVLAIDAPGELISPFSGDMFPCLIWDHDGRFTGAQRSETASRLLLAGCRYAVCGGRNCAAWHDAFDEEFLAQHVDGSHEARDAAHVMTTLHDDETPDDVAFFFVMNTNFDDHDFERYLVLHVGDDETTQRELDAAVRRHAAGGRLPSA